MCQNFTAHFGVIGERLRAFNIGKTFRATRGESAATSDSKAPRTPTEFEADSERLLASRTDSTARRAVKITRVVAMDAVVQRR